MQIPERLLAVNSPPSVVVNKALILILNGNVNEIEYQTSCTNWRKLRVTGTLPLYKPQKSLNSGKPP